MNTTEYTKWMQRAFLNVESALGQELITPARLCMTEDHIRSALVRGLAAALPNQAHRIRTEETVTWTNNPCWEGTGRAPRQGRPIQHDVFIAPVTGDNGMACEVKWLKAEQGDAVLRDIWKLVLSRGVHAERGALRTYLLLGGEAKHFRATINALYHTKPRLADLSWQRTKQALPKPKTLSMSVLLNSRKGPEALKELLRWGSIPTYRTPPDCRTQFHTVARASWIRPHDGQIVVEGRTLVWNAALWEITAHKVSGKKLLDWAKYRDQFISNVTGTDKG